MNSIKTWNTTAPQSRIAMPTFGTATLGTSTYAFGGGVCARVDAPAVKHDASLIEGATVGTSVWRQIPD